MYASPMMPKPFFAVAPPTKAQIERLLLESEHRVEASNENNVDDASLLKPQWVSFVGTITGVRQMAKRLVFVDIAPPSMETEPTNLDTDPALLYPWRNPNTQKDMAVQLIVGKTFFCQQQRNSEYDANAPNSEEVLKRMKPGQWIFVQGKTNVGNKDSLRNWQQKNSLDVVVFDFEWVQPMGEIGSRSVMNGRNPNAPSKALASPSPRATPQKPTLTWNDFYPGSNVKHIVQLVDTMDTLTAMKNAVTEWLLRHPNSFGLVGIDCEWKPNFLAEYDNQAQPVLVLQICVHPLETVYLMDLQSLLRPIELPTEPMTEQEQTVSAVLQSIFQTKRFIKVGFQVLNDLQKLAASYPHVYACQQIESILETSKFAMKVFQMTQVAHGRRLASSSLNTLTEHMFQGKVLDKAQQISDWSQRPLSQAQQDYAAMDAAVVVGIANQLMQSAGATVILEDLTIVDQDKQFYPAPSSNIAPLLGRFENDAAFGNVIVSARFLYLDATEEQHAIHRLRAKSHIGSSSDLSFLVATQTWNTRASIPEIPTFADDGSGVYTDLNGAKRVPSQTIEIDSANLERFHTMVGTRIAKSKNGCVLSLLADHPMLGDSNVIVDFPQRTGYVELRNAVVLFVTLPLRAGYKRAYPNEWLEDGAILSWFLRENDWSNAESSLAKKLLGGDDTKVILFARRGKGHFLNCGQCRVAEGPNADGPASASTTRDGKLVRLFLLLQDWTNLYSKDNFQQLVFPK
ncbi:MAG: hypothetical protein SGILL_003953 [Bacillariaceae sp.]